MKQKEDQLALTKQQPPTYKNTKTGVPGRPQNTKDSGPRKQKEFKPKVKAAMELWAKSAQIRINEVITPVFLSYAGKNSVRNLTGQETRQLEAIKFEILCNLEMGQVVDKKILGAINKNPLPQIHSEFEGLVASVQKELNSKLTIEQIRDLRAQFYVNYKMQTKEVISENE